MSSGKRTSSLNFQPANSQTRNHAENCAVNLDLKEHNFPENLEHTEAAEEPVDKEKVVDEVVDDIGTKSKQEEKPFHGIVIIYISFVQFELSIIYPCYEL